MYVLKSQTTSWKFRQNECNVEKEIDEKTQILWKIS